MTPLRAFLEWVPGERVPGSHLAVSTKPSGGTRADWRDHSVPDVDAAEQFILQHRSVHDVYLGAAWFAGNGPRDGVVAKAIITADIDAKCFRGGTQEQMAQAWQVCHALGVPSVIVCTGGGYHLHVLLPEGSRLQDPPRDEGRRRVEVLGRALRLYAQDVAHRVLSYEVKLDHVHDLARVVRVPDTWNFKDPSGPRQVYVAHPTHPEQVAEVQPIDLRDLEPHIQRATAGDRSSGRQARRTGKRIQVPTALKAEWPLPTGDQSEHDWRVAKACLEDGRPREDAAALIRSRRDGLRDHEGRAKGSRDAYVEATVSRAYGRDDAENDAPISSAAQLQKLDFRTAAEIHEEQPPEVEWVWEGVLASGSLNLLSGKPKESGKTTLAVGMSGAITQGVPLLGRQTRQGGVLYLFEEPAVTFTLKAMEFGAGEVRCLSAFARGGHDLPSVVEAAAETAVAHGCVALVVDTFACWARLEGEEENSSAEVRRALAPLRQAANEGLAVVVIHHVRKGESSLSDAPRGSTALAAEVDVLMNLGRAPGALDLRELQAVGRFTSEPVRIVYGRMPGGLFLPHEEVLIDAKRERLLAPLQGTCLKSKEWQERAGMNKAEFLRMRRALLEEGVVAQEDSPDDKRARIYRLAATAPLETGGEETGDAVPPVGGGTTSPPPHLPPVERGSSNGGTGSDDLGGRGSNAVPEPDPDDGVAS